MVKKIEKFFFFVVVGGDLILTLKEGYYGMNWQDCLVGGIFRGALGVI